MTIVDVSHVDLIYQERHAETLAIQDLTFSVEEGEFVSIVGPSGCGKTSVLSLLTGLVPPTRGKVTLLGGAAEAARSVGYMLQRDALFPWRTVEENVLLGLEVRRLLTPARRERAFELLERYGLGAFRGHFPRQLSGGMRQKVALIRTLALDPALLLLDEPFSSLDYQTRLLLGDEVFSILSGEKKTAILVTHDIAEAVSMSGRILVFSDRPAHVKRTFSVSLDPGETPLMRRKDVRFSGVFDAVWKELDNHDGND